jgi:hypothetical protein
MKGAAFLAIIAAGYMLASWWFPFRNCMFCHGAGKIRSEGRKTFRYCRWCKGTGARLRIGRRLWNIASRAHHRTMT